MLCLFSLCAPLLGTFLNPLVALTILGIALFFKNGTSIYLITFGIPTIVATLCWIVECQTTTIARTAKILLNVVLPLACIIVFAAHPVGSHAITYACYWFIPPILFLFNNQNTFLKLLNSATRITLITHALGSIFWLYALKTTPTFWLALIPVVAIERLSMAGITTIMLGIIKIAGHRFVACPAKT